MERNDLLEKAGAWKDDLPHSGIRLISHLMDYTFFSPGIFSKGKSDDQMIKHFKEVINLITTSYAANWTKKEITEKGKELKKFFLDFALFKETLDLEKTYSEISDGENPASIYLPISNVLFEMKRFGDSLGINLKSGNGRANEVHINGTDLLKESCQEEFVLQEFMHSIEIIVPLEKKPEANNAVSINLKEEWKKLSKPYDCFAWLEPNKFSEYLENAYTKLNDFQANIGYYKTEKTQLKILGKLVHINADPDGTTTQRNWSHTTSEKQWRKGNIEEIMPMIYAFSSGNDLCLSISIESGLPECNLLKKTNLASIVSYNQSVLKKAGASLDLQLRAQQLAESGQRT